MTKREKALDFLCGVCDHDCERAADCPDLRDFKTLLAEPNDIDSANIAAIRDVVARYDFDAPGANTFYATQGMRDTIKKIQGIVKEDK